MGGAEDTWTWSFACGDRGGSAHSLFRHLEAPAAGLDVGEGVNLRLAFFARLGIQQAVLLDNGLLVLLLLLLPLLPLLLPLFVVAVVWLRI